MREGERRDNPEKKEGGWGDGGWRLSSAASHPFT
jgi:hypothetical protein